MYQNTLNADSADHYRLVIYLLWRQLPLPSALWPLVVIDNSICRRQYYTSTQVQKRSGGKICHVYGCSPYLFFLESIVHQLTPSAENYDTVDFHLQGVWQVEELNLQATIRPMTLFILFWGNALGIQCGNCDSTTFHANEVPNFELKGLNWRLRNKHCRALSGFINLHRMGDLKFTYQFNLPLRHNLVTI